MKKIIFSICILLGLAFFINSCQETQNENSVLNEMPCLSPDIQHDNDVTGEIVLNDVIIT